MLGTPNGLRMHIGIFGRRNVGKSSILNAITSQEASIVSEVAGTTTDPVDKAMELLPFGPVLFVDTAGIDDAQETIGALRTKKTAQVFDRCDMALVVCEAGVWGSYETELCEQMLKRSIPIILVVNKMDMAEEAAWGADADAIADANADAGADADACTDDADVDTITGAAARAVDAARNSTLQVQCLQKIPKEYRELPVVFMTAALGNNEASGVLELREAIIEHAPDEFINDPTIVGDLIPQGSTALLVVPIDKEAPKGRLILPQAQVIRDLLDTKNHAYVVQVDQVVQALQNLKTPPALVVTDSQAFGEVANIVPPEIPLTGFSILFSRFKGDLKTQVQGIQALSNLTEASKVLIAEACTHHPIEEDIGTVKIPAFLRKTFGDGIAIEHVRGATFPSNLAEYDLVIHCGGCMFNRRRMLSRIHACVAAGVPITNYGLVLAYANGAFMRSIQIFPELRCL